MQGTIVEPLDIYWINVFGSLKAVCIALSVMAAVMLVVSVIGLLYNADYETYCSSYRLEHKRYYDMSRVGVILSIPLAIVATASSIFIPSSQTMIGMLVAKYATYENVDLTVEGIKSIVDYITQALQSLN